MAVTHSLRHRLILGTAMAGALLTGYGRAFAGSCTVGGGSYICSGAAATPAGSDAPIILNFISPIFGASISPTGFGVDYEFYGRDGHYDQCERRVPLLHRQL